MEASVEHVVFTANCLLCLWLHLLSGTSALVDFSQQLDGNLSVPCGMSPAVDELLQGVPDDLENPEEEEVGSQNDRMSRIIGGEDTTHGQFPYLVSLKYNGVRHFCGGSLISSRWVLTAAHCVSGPVGNFLTAVVGEYNIKLEGDGEVNHKIEKILPHEGFRFSDLNNDIALVRLKEPVTFSDIIQPVCLVTDDKADIPSRSRRIVAGWGRVEEGGILPDKPLHVEIRQIDADRCRVHLLHKLKVGEGQICAGALRGKKDACQGDSGGPLTAFSAEGKMMQQGIVSSGIGCGRRAKPGVYTKITAYIPWIVKTIKEYEKSKDPSADVL